MGKAGVAEVGRKRDTKTRRGKAEGSILHKKIWSGFVTGG